MKPRWVRALSEQESKEMEVEYKKAVLLRERLSSILDEEIQKSLSEMRDGAKTVGINLTEYYADELSKQRTLEWVIKLIK